MQREVTVDNRTYLVEFERQGAKVAVKVDGRSYLVDALPVRGGFYSFLLDGHSHEVLVGRENDHFSVVIDGQTMAVDFYDPRSRRPVDEGRRPASGARQVICAPMAGRIVRFKVAVGDMVQDGEGLIVLEAMKMENELKSLGLGQVKEILVAADDVVSPGQKLMIIE